MTARPLAAEGGNVFTALNGIPQVDFPSNLQAALAAGRRMTSILGEVVALRHAPGRLALNEYFYYRLWAPRPTRKEKRRFVGKQAQHPMHLACNDIGWYATAADKLLFHALMAGAGLPRPDLLAITQPARRVPGARILTGESAIVAFLRDRTHYPLFAKPIDGKYSMSVINADSYEVETDRILLLGTEPTCPETLARELAGRKAGFLVQRRLPPHPSLVQLFGPRLWSVRVIALLTPEGPVIHRAVAKIATGQKPADNFWRTGNMLGAIELETGKVGQVVRGTEPRWRSTSPIPIPASRLSAR